MKPPVRIVDIMGDLVAKTSAKLLTYLQTIDPLIKGVHYQYGHYNDIKERLLAKGKIDPTARYPLVVLFEDFRVQNRTPGIFGIADIKIMVLCLTKKEYTRQQREEKSFKPVLVPIYDELFRQMKLSGKFMQYGPFRHNRIDRPHWGDPAIYGPNGYLFDEVLDGIEISDLQLQTYLNNCVTA